MLWREFGEAAPEFAAAGQRLMQQNDGPWIAMLATVSAAGVPRMAPICPPGTYPVKRRWPERD